MKRTLIDQPFVVIPIAVATVALLAHTSWRLHSENQSLRAAQTPTPSHASQFRGDPATHALENDEPPAHVRLAELRTQLADETAARTALETKAAELAAKLPTKEGEIVVSFGRIEQMGQASAKLVGFFTGETGKKMMNGKELSPEEQQQMMKVLQKHLVQIPELQRMEDDAREISRYHASALKETYGLDSATSEKAAKYLEAEFTRLKAEGLTFSQRTEAEKAAWETRRDAAMKDLATRVRPMLPANHPSLALLPGLLNLGEGMRTTVQMNGDGKGAVHVTLPLLPAISGF